MSAYTLAPSAALKSAKRGSAKRAGLYAIEGEYVTADGLAAPGTIRASIGAGSSGSWRSGGGTASYRPTFKVA